MQCQPQKNDTQIIFGSLDLETLRSVGIFSTKLTELQSPNGSDRSVPDNAPKETLPSDSGSIPVSEADVVEENGHASVVSDSAHNFSINSTTELPGSNGHASRGSSENAVLHDSRNGTKHVKSTRSTYKVSNWPNPVHKTFLPRGLVNLGNLCFLNATLQALLSCTPFLELLHELRHRAIPEVPAESAFIAY